MDSQEILAALDDEDVLNSTGVVTSVPDIRRYQFGEVLVKHIRAIISARKSSP